MNADLRRWLYKKKIWLEIPWLCIQTHFTKMYLFSGVSRLWGPSRQTYILKLYPHIFFRSRFLLLTKNNFILHLHLITFLTKVICFQVTLGFEAHQDTMKRSGSTAKNRFVVWLRTNPRYGSTGYEEFRRGLQN